MPTQKELDLEIADRLEDFTSNLSTLADIRGKMSEVEYLNIVSALRYAIATLRSTHNE